MVQTNLNKCADNSDHTNVDEVIVIPSQHSRKRTTNMKPMNILTEATVQASLHEDSPTQVFIAKIWALEQTNIQLIGKKNSLKENHKKPTVYQELHNQNEKLIKEKLLTTNLESQLQNIIV